LVADSLGLKAILPVLVIQLVCLTLCDNRVQTRNKRNLVFVYYDNVSTGSFVIFRCINEYHIAVILIEHRLELLGAIADRVCVLDLGAVIAEGDPKGVFSDPAVRAAYFEGAT